MDEFLTVPVSLFNGWYTATFDGNVFESNYLRIEGIEDGTLKTTTKKGGVTTTVTKADLKNIYLSDAYNHRVYDIILQMTQSNPNGDEQRMYTKACQQALQEVLDGKLKL
jgi:hypothetical protein